MGAQDLSALLRDLSVTRRPGRWCLVTGPVGADVILVATVLEDEGPSSVVSVADAEQSGQKPGFVAAWLTLDVESALDTVGLTAAVATALAADGIACNVLAGFHHDHLLVPEERADDAVACLRRLRSSS